MSPASDGYRIGSFVEGGKVRLITRNGQTYTAALPEVVAAVRGPDERRGAEPARYGGVG